METTGKQRIPEVILERKKDKDNSVFLTFRGDPRLLNEPVLRVRVTGPAASDLPSGADHAGPPAADQAGECAGDRVFPVFRQNAMNYGIWSQYVSHHGCACCSLTSLLAAFCPDCRGLRPNDTIEIVEKKHFPEDIWQKNYQKDLSGQMPVTLYGISQILSAEGIDNEYVGAFRDREALTDIKGHLRKGLPVVIETSRMRRGRRTGLPVSFNDRRYAGSYHTMILLGLDRNGHVVFADSATRDWAGERQRLKSDDLMSLIQYMFPQRRTGARNLYYDHRWNTGGYIKVLPARPPETEAIEKAGGIG